MRRARAITGLLAGLLAGACALIGPAAAAAAKVRSLTLGVAQHAVLDPTTVEEADLATSPAGDLALIWGSQGAERIVTRAVGARFRGPVVLPGALQAKTSTSNLTLEPPVVGVGGGTLVSWRNGAERADLGLLQVAAADPGQPVVIRAPLVTLPAIGESPRGASRVGVASDGGAAMAVVRGGAVLVTQRAAGGDFGPEVVASAPGEDPDSRAVQLLLDDGGGVTVSWSSTLPCTTIDAPSCDVNRVAARPSGGVFGPPRSLAEVRSGPTPGYRGRDTKHLDAPAAAAAGATGLNVLAWQRVNPGSFDGVEVSVGSAARGYSGPITLPATSSATPVPGATCKDRALTPRLLGAVPGGSKGLIIVLIQRVTGCGSDVEAFTIAPNGSVTNPGVLVSGVGIRAPQLLHRGASAVLVVRSVRTIRAAFANDGAFGPLRRVSVQAAERFGPAAVLRDGSLLAEYGRGCGAAGRTDSTISVLAPNARTAVLRRVGRCGIQAPSVADSSGALTTFSLRAALEAAVTCPVPAALAAQRDGRRARCR